MAKKLNYEGGAKATEINKEKPQAPANFTDKDANDLAQFFASKADSQLKEGVDWTADGSSDKATLFSLLATNDFVNIVATNGTSLIGKVMELGADASAPIKVNGIYIDNQGKQVIGIITMTVNGATYNVVPVAKFYDAETVDQKLGELETRIQEKLDALTNGKQDKLTAPQLAVLAGVAVSQADKTTWNGKQDALTAAQLAILGGVVFTQALLTKYNGYEALITTATTTANGAMPKPTVDGLQIISKSGATTGYKAVVEEPVDYIKDATTTKEIKHIRSA